MFALQIRNQTRHIHVHLLRNWLKQKWKRGCTSVGVGVWVCVYADHRSTVGQPWMLFPRNCLSTLLFHWAWNSLIWPRLTRQQTLQIHWPPPPTPSPTQPTHSAFLLETGDQIQIQAFCWLNSTPWNTFLKNNFKYKDNYQGDVVGGRKTAIMYRLRKVERHLTMQYGTTQVSPKAHCTQECCNLIITGK